MIAVTILLGLLLLGNLTLTAGVVRRLREHSAVLDRLVDPPQAMLPAGSAPDDFAVTAVDGTPIAPELLATPTLVGFFSPTCGPCHELLPEFLARARRAPAGRTLAVVVSAEPDRNPMAASLAEVALVVVERPAGPLAKAFGVRALPAFGLVDEGRITASSTSLAPIPLLVAA